MAGIGFELKGLFKNKGCFSNIKGYFLSTMVTTGPTLFCITMIISMQWLLKYFGESLKNIDIFIAVVVYAFAFSLIITGGITIFASRYVSDCIYQKKNERIIPSLLGFITITLIIIFICGNLFFLKSNLNTVVKITSYIIFAELSVIWIETVYIYVIKDYIVVSEIFFMGVILIFAVLVVLIKIFLVIPMVAMLFSMALGFMLMLVMFFIKLFHTFEVKRLLPSDCFEFLKSIDLYPELILVGLFYFLGMYGHNLIFWLSAKKVVVENTFYTAPFYDVPVFYALLTIIPVTVLFIIKVETSFYEKYKEYYAMVQGGGSFKDIKRARIEMINTLSIELRYLIEIQLFITFLSIVIGKRFLPQLGLSMMSTDIFCIVALGCFGYIVMYVLMVILLYFDDRTSAMTIAFIFFISNIFFAGITLSLGSAFYGYGFFLSSLISMALAFLRLQKCIDNLDYRTFGAQPIFKKIRVGVFSKIYDLIKEMEDNKFEKLQKP